MSHGLMWLPLLVAFVVLTALGWLERRRQKDGKRAGTDGDATRHGHAAEQEPNFRGPN